MRLHNRQIRASFWNDPDLAFEFTRDERLCYTGLWQLADDSGCLECDPRTIKLLLFPIDADVTPEVISKWIDHFVGVGKLIPYEVSGRRCGSIKNFHIYQTLDKPAPPSRDSVPLPEWIKWVEGDSRRTSRYVVRDLSGTCPGQEQDVPP